MRAYRVAGDDHPFNELVGVLVDDVAVLECAGFGVVAVADQVNGRRVVRRNEGPLHACGEMCIRDRVKRCLGDGIVRSSCASAGSNAGFLRACPGKLSLIHI